MSKNKRDSLEDFFIKGTQDYQFEYNEADWKKLETKLDQVDRGGVWPFWSSNGFKMIILALIIGSLIFTFNSYVFNKNNVDSFSNPQADNQVIHSNPPLVALSDTLIVSDNVLVADEKESDNLTSSITRQYANENLPKIGASNSVNPNEGLSGMVGTKMALNKSANLDHADNFLEDQNSDVSQNLNENYIVGDGNINQWDFSSIEPIGVAINNPYQYTGLDLTVSEKEILKENELIDNEEDKKAGYPKVTLAFQYSPDLSSVGLGDFSETGSRYGGMLGIELSKRTTLSIGALRIQNYYSANGDQYSPSRTGYGSSPVTPIPIRATGECDILEIPISFRYNYLNRGKHHFFLSGGLSSYIMLDEYYEFEYYNSSQNPNITWQSKKTSSHIFGILNLSTGYEYNVAPRWSLQVEPFINIPITGIGWGNVDLYSIGSYFSIKYILFHAK